LFLFLPIKPKLSVGDTSDELVLGGGGIVFDNLPVIICLMLSAIVAMSGFDLVPVVGGVVVELVVELSVVVELAVVVGLDVGMDVGLDVGMDVGLDVGMDVGLELELELVGVVELDVLLSKFSKSVDICEQAKQINMTNPSPSALLQVVVATNPRTNNNLPKIVRNKKFFEII
jgi:hypothetical protein